MKLKYIIIFLLLAISLEVNAQNNANSSSVSQSSRIEELELPVIPSSLRSPSERASYLIEHYWDNLDFTDTVKVQNSNLMEQSLVNFLSVLPYAENDDIIENGFAILLNKSCVNKNAFTTVVNLSETYLSEKDSPMVSDQFYVDFLKALQNVECLSSVEKLRTADRLEMISKNMPGSLAENFEFTTLNGETTNLMNSLPSGDTNLLLIFFDPDCENCDVVMNRIRNNEEINKQISNNNIKVLAIYSGGNKEGWRRKGKTLPFSWTVGINSGEIEDNDLYFFPYMPTIYLLDNKGKILDRNIEF